MFWLSFVLLWPAAALAVWVVVWMMALLPWPGWL